MRLVGVTTIFALLAQVAIAPAYAEDFSDVRFSGHELMNIWKYCDVSGRARTAKVRCINEQTEKLARGKDIQKANAKAEALTREEVGAIPPSH